MAIKDDVFELIEPALKVLGYDLASVTFLKQGKNYILRVVIDKEGPISMDDIIRAGDLISPLLDEKDLIKTSYLLDITSLGIDKVIAFENLAKYLNKDLDIRLNVSINKKNRFSGTLQEVNNESLVLLLSTKKAKTITLHKDQIHSIRQVIKI